MIRLRLLMFGGGGSKSGTGKTNAVTSTAPGSPRGGGGRSFDGSKKEEEEKKPKSLTLGAYVTSPNKIEKKSEYVLVNPKEGRMNARSGSDLLKLIEDKKIRYDKKIDLWVSRNGKYYELRKRKR